MGFYGMDTAQGESFAQLISDRRGAIEDRASQLDGVISGIDSFWRGSDATSFREDWRQVNITQIETAVDRLMELAREIAEHAQEQDVASAEGARGAIGERIRDLFPGGGPLENPLLAFLDPRNWATGAFGVLKSSGKRMLDAAADIFAHGGEDAIVPWLRNTHGLRAAAKYLGPLGDVLTFGFAANDRWNEDAGDPSLSDTERGVRAVADGGANLGGALAGAAVGAKGGAIAGAAIGSIFPGAGTAIGGVVGGAVGGIVGGIAGGGLADAAVDWFLG